jgi:hypothetical protein
MSPNPGPRDSRDIHVTLVTGHVTVVTPDDTSLREGDNDGDGEDDDGEEDDDRTTKPRHCRRKSIRSETKLNQ